MTILHRHLKDGAPPARSHQGCISFTDVLSPRHCDQVSKDVLVIPFNRHQVQHSSFQLTRWLRRLSLISECFGGRRGQRHWCRATTNQMPPPQLPLTYRAIHFRERVQNPAFWLRSSTKILWRSETTHPNPPGTNTDATTICGSSSTQDMTAWVGQITLRVCNHQILTYPIHDSLQKDRLVSSTLTEVTTSTTLVTHIE